MNKYLLLVLPLLGLSSFARASDNIEIDAGVLYNATGTALSNGTGLLQLIASPNGVFTAPTASLFVTGNNILVDSFTMNNAFGTGEADLDAVFSLTGGIAAGDALLLRWFPTLTTSSASPGLGATYGQYRSNTSETGADSSGISWFVPATDGVTLSYPGGLDFNTIAAGGSNPEITGYASNVVLVPEPSTLAALGCGLVGLTLLLGARRFQKAKSA